MNQGILLSELVNYAEGKKRFGGKAELYEKYLGKFPEDRNYADMVAAYENGEYEAAFRYAHALKGLAGNLSLNKLYEQIVPLVEAFRAGQAPASETIVDAVRESYRKTVALILDAAQEG